MVDSGAEGSRRRGAVIVALVALLLAGVGVGVALAVSGDEGETLDFEVDDDVRPLGEERAGSVASLVDCEDWVSGSEERRKATVIDIREQLSSAGRFRTSLPDPEAYEVFESACANDFAEAFRLYKLYYQANAWHGFDPADVPQAVPPEQ